MLNFKSYETLTVLLHFVLSKEGLCSSAGPSSLHDPFGNPSHCLAISDTVHSLNSFVVITRYASYAQRGACPRSCRVELSHQSSLEDRHVKENRRIRIVVWIPIYHYSICPHSYIFTTNEGPIPTTVPACLTLSSLPYPSAQSPPLPPSTPLPPNQD